MCADLVCETGNPSKDPAADADAKARNRILGADGVEEPAQARSIGTGRGEADHKVRRPTADLGKQVVRFDAPAEEQHIETIGFGDPGKDLSCELLAGRTTAGHQHLPATGGVLGESAFQTLDQLRQQNQRAVFVNWGDLILARKFVDARARGQASSRNAANESLPCAMYSRR